MRATVILSRSCAPIFTAQGAEAVSTPSNQLDTITVAAKKPNDPVAPGTQQYGRQLSLIVANKGGAGLELNQFHVTFHVNRGDYQNPNTADIRVYNLSRQTAN